MSKIRNIALGLAIVSSFTVPAVSLAQPVGATETAETLDININVSDIISMAITSSHDSGGTSKAQTTILPNNDNVSQDTTTDMYTNISVSTNNPDGYTLTLVDADNNANLQNSDGATIAPISSEPAGGSNPGWAVRVDGQSTWSAVPAANSGNVVTIKNYTPSPKAVTNNDQSKVYYGIAASSDQATGVYTDVVTYTATVK